MKKIIRGFLSIAVIAVIFFIKNGANFKPNPVTKIDDLTIEAGKTTLQDLLDNGFVYEFNELIQPTKFLDAKTYTLCSDLKIKKNNEEYAKVQLVNKSDKSKSIEDCFIGDIDISVNKENTHKFNNLTLDNKNLNSLALNDVKSVLKDDPSHEDDKSLRYSYDKCEYNFKLDENKNITDVSVNLNIYKLK